MADISYLKKIPIFSNLTETDLKIIDSISIVRSYDKGRIIFMEGEPGEAFFYVKSGRVKISKLSADGREHILHILGPGHLFAEVTLFSGLPYPATAEVMETSEIGIIRNFDLEKAIMGNPELALQLIKYLNNRLMEAQNKVRNLALYDTYARTAQAVIKLSEEHGKIVPRGVELDLNISRQELANIVGTTRETCIRALMAFKKEKAIDIDKNTITIIDKDKLSQWFA